MSKFEENIITNIDINQILNDSIPVNVFYYQLKENKKLKDDNIISSDEPLVLIDICNDTDMINVCSFNEKEKKYFWVFSDEVLLMNKKVENWKINDIKINLKTIKEEWITKKNMKK